MSEVDLNAPEVKAAIKAEAKRLLDEEAGGLKRAKEEALDELKELKKKYEGIDPAEFKKLKQKMQKLEDEGRTPEEIQRRIEEEFAPKLSQAEQDRDDAVKKLSDLQIDNQLTSALIENGVPKEFIRAVKADILSTSREKMQVKDGGVIVDGTPVADFAKKWAGDEANKPFISAPDNRGGGGGGGGGGGAGTAKKTSEMTRAEKSEFIAKEGLEAWKEKLNNESPSK
ncbi:ElaB/YqjD/DUF883 family membrane-anchored ribosome-binding protein [Bradyrhizobium sp. LB8.2]|uniref:hypothetical protein n=1 Tax=unclassified Bradyrhizobium TaxID=2631580 RepID=UPI003397B432